MTGQSRLDQVTLHRDARRAGPTFKSAVFVVTQPHNDLSAPPAGDGTQPISADARRAFARVLTGGRDPAGVLVVRHRLGLFAQRSDLE
jgi:hypothetical protein